MLVLEIFKFFPAASALVMPPKPREDVSLSEAIARIAGAEGQNGESQGEFRAHFVTPHVIASIAASGPSALIASQMDWSSQRDS